VDVPAGAAAENITYTITDSQNHMATAILGIALKRQKGLEKGMLKRLLTMKQQTGNPGKIGKAHGLVKTSAGSGTPGDNLNPTLQLIHDKR